MKAVIAEVLEPEDAALIGDTRLGLMTVSEAAQGLGISSSAAYERRRQAEAKLVAWLVGPDYEPGFLENRANSP
jgi:transposase-like protein